MPRLIDPPTQLACNALAGLNGFAMGIFSQMPEGTADGLEGVRGLIYGLGIGAVLIACVDFSTRFAVRLEAQE